jgi:hypothetical protein
MPGGTSNRLSGTRRSPLGLAARLGNESILRMLLRAGAEMEWDRRTGYSTLLDTKNMEGVTWAGALKKVRAINTAVLDAATKNWGGGKEPGGTIFILLAQPFGRKKLLLN